MSTQVESNSISEEVSIPADEPKEYTSEGDEILSQSNLRSEHWPHFQRIILKATGVYKARCIYCKKKLVGDPKSGTTHLGDHVKSCTKKKMIDGKQKILTSGLMRGEGKKANVETYSYDPEFARKQLAYMIIMHEYPLRMVEHIWFRKFCYALNPGFKVVSRYTIKRDIFKIYDVEKVKSMRLMEKNRSRVSLTTDMWTSSNQKKGFMVITAHFVDDTWKLQSRIIRDSVAYWTATPKREEKFEDAARQLGIMYGRKLSLDCPTRWNSTFLMLQTAIEYRSAFGRLKLKDSQYKCCPNDDDWYLAQDICERLEVFYKVTLLFSGTSYPTSNLFFPDVCDIKVTLSEWACCGIDLVEEMAYKMIEKYDKYWDNTHGFLGVAVVLDPRFKMTLIGYYYKMIYGEVLGEEMAEAIRTRLYDLVTLYQGKTNKNCGESTTSSNLSKPPTTYLKCKNRLSDFDSYRENLKKAKTSHVKSELEYYLEEEELPRREAFEDADIPTINDEDMDIDECMSDVTTIDD
ncbi:hypothetical protein Vadar_024320 [Vaccinium darrowii]|uniref:Uncharacterized protein n=1 Tax=Vaccinium darrowii TaxID=229202 RepID=A0ACB7ZMM8_9ERIC|nr:hypothetical protein Vadar_024320 [Vaccinium darrowii]